MVRKERTKPPHTLFYSEDAKYVKYLRTFGEMAVRAISDGKKMRSKLDKRGRTGIFVGYADDHPGNVYRFINVQTKKIILSRDVQWLNSFWKQYKTRNNDSRNLVEEFSQMMRMMRIWKKVTQKRTKSVVMVTTPWNKKLG